MYTCEAHVNINVSRQYLSSFSNFKKYNQFDFDIKIGKKGGDQEITKEILKRNKGKIERENTKNCRGVAWQECQ